MTVHICIILFRKHTKRTVRFPIFIIYLGIIIHILLGFTSIVPVTSDFYYEGIWIRRDTPLYGTWVTLIVSIFSLFNIILNFLGYRYANNQTAKTLFLYSLILIPLNFIAVMTIITLLPTAFVPSIPTLYIMVSLCIFLLLGMIKYNLFPQYEKKYYTMFYKSPICNFVLDENFYVTEANKQAIDYFQRPIVHENFSELMRITNNFNQTAPFFSLLKEKREIESYNLTLNHFFEDKTVHFVINAVAIEDNGETFYYIMFLDRTLEILQQEKIHHLAYYDTLTQLPNRAAFMRYAHTHFNDTQEAYLFLIDLNDFKFVNDTYGHAAGDAVLVKVGSILQELTNGKHFSARLGGDEFILYCNVEENLSFDTFLTAVNHSLNHAVTNFNNIQLPLSASIGYAKKSAYPSVDEWIHAADQYMYNRKKINDHKNKLMYSHDALTYF